MKLKKFKILFAIFILFLLIVITFLPLFYETVIKENKIESNEKGFFAKFYFRANSTIFYNNTSNIIHGIINIFYTGAHYFIIGSIYNKNRINNFYYNTTDKSAIIRWLLPNNVYKSNSKMVIFNNKSEHIENARNTFGKNEYSGIGIINPVLLCINNTKYQNNTYFMGNIYKNSFLEYGESTSSSILLYSIWHGKLKPFTEIFPAVNYSKELIINMNNTNMKISPIDINYYINPEIYIDIFMGIFMILFYYVVVSMARKNK